MYFEGFIFPKCVNKLQYNFGRMFFFCKKRIEFKYRKQKICYKHRCHWTSHPPYFSFMNFGHKFKMAFARGHLILQFYNIHKNARASTAFKM